MSRLPEVWLSLLLLVIGSSVAVFVGRMRSLIAQATLPAALREFKSISRALDQGRPAFDKRPADHAALLIVEFNLQTLSPGSGIAASRQLAHARYCVRSMFRLEQRGEQVEHFRQFAGRCRLKHMQWCSDGQDRADKVGKRCWSVREGFARLDAKALVIDSPEGHGAAFFVLPSAPSRNSVATQFMVLLSRRDA